MKTVQVEIWKRLRCGTVERGDGAIDDGNSIKFSFQSVEFIRFTDITIFFIIVAVNQLFGVTNLPCLLKVRPTTQNACLVHYNR